MGVNDLTVLGGSRVESFGARLKREREQQGMELEGVAAATKIGVRMLQALEEERFGQLPGGIFNKGFVRAYARHLGLDEEQAIADYLVAAGGPTPSKEPEAVLADLAARAVEIRPGNEPRRSGDIPWGKLSILLLVVAVAFALWSARSRESRSSEEVSRSDAPAAAAPAPGLDPSHASARPAGGPAASESARSASSEQDSPGAGGTASPPAADQAPGPGRQCRLLRRTHSGPRRFLARHNRRRQAGPSGPGAGRIREGGKRSPGNRGQSRECCGVGLLLQRETGFGRRPAASSENHQI